MKMLKITLTKGTETTVTDVKSECAMWNALRKVRDEITDEQLTAGVRAVVTDADGNPFKDITFRRNSKGKIEMPNAVKETNRVRPTKGEKKTAKAKTAKKLKGDVAPSGATVAEMADVLADTQELAVAAGE